METNKNEALDELHATLIEALTIAVQEGDSKAWETARKLLADNNISADPELMGERAEGLIHSLKVDLPFDEGLASA